MPRVISRPDRNLEAALREWSRYEDSAQWRRSARGNLWRRWNEVTVTVFRRGASFNWCIADPDEETRFAPRGYSTEREAIKAAGEAAGVAYWFMPRRLGKGAA